MDEPQLTIGEVARRAELNASAIRFYERRGLLPAPERNGSHRRYTPGVVDRLQVIDIAKRAGFTLDETQTILEVSDSGRPAGQELRGLIDRKLDDVDALIARAAAMREWLLLARECSCSSLELCELFEQARTSRE
jgi:MerR family transcriptional regulator, redox-sensitive transcriptional activator SoxR